MRPPTALSSMFFIFGQEVNCEIAKFSEPIISISSINQNQYDHHSQATINVEYSYLRKKFRNKKGFFSTITVDKLSQLLLSQPQPNHNLTQTQHNITHRNSMSPISQLLLIQFDKTSRQASRINNNNQVFQLCQNPLKLWLWI